MPQTSQPTNGSEGSVKVGTTGTIGSLMSRELESMKQTPQAASSQRKKPQSPPVSVPCGSTPKKLQEKKNSFINEQSNSNSGDSNSHSDHRGQEKSHKARHNTRKNGSQIPMLGSDGISTDRNPNGKRVAKKGHAYIVEVVDLKCNNPMSSRLKKLGFSKLSESIV